MPRPMPRLPPVTSATGVGQMACAFTKRAPAMPLAFSGVVGQWNWLSSRGLFVDNAYELASRGGEMIGSDRPTGVTFPGMAAQTVENARRQGDGTATVLATH